MSVAELELSSWRREVSELYAAVRREDEPERGHALWPGFRSSSVDSAAVRRGCGRGVDGKLAGN